MLLHFIAIETRKKREVVTTADRVTDVCELLQNKNTGTALVLYCHYYTWERVHVCVGMYG